MEIKIKECEKFWKVAVEGRLVAVCAEELKEALASKVATKPQVLFDMSKMTHVDSSGLGALVQVYQKAKAGGGIVRIAALQAHPRIVFEITKVSTVFELFDTVEEAEKAFG